MRGDKPLAILKAPDYSEERQHLFARLSGDRNPMHVDAVAARRTLVGKLVVHGIHQALNTVDALLSWRTRQGLPVCSIAALNAQFLKPVAVGDPAELHLLKAEDNLCRLAWKLDDTILCKVTVRLGPAAKSREVELRAVPNDIVSELTFDDLKNRSGALALGMDVALANNLFPAALTTLGSLGLAEILALTRLVGMHCPGMHSIFAQADLRFDAKGDTEVLNYRVEKVDERYSRVEMTVHGPTLQGDLLTYFRPPPVAQAGMATVKGLVGASAFSESVALIVGGSRGLGEITAKIIAAGGGLPIITYNQGGADAKKLVDEIRDHGGRCEMLQLDVSNKQQAKERLGEVEHPVHTLYYFATTRIFGRRHGFFDHSLLSEFNAVYVQGFSDVVDILISKCPTKLRVFYPSTVAVDERSVELAEYGLSKSLGESLCSFYNTHCPKVEITIERLPRIATDQTSTVTAYPAKGALEVMLPLVQVMESAPAARVTG
jgi:hypothetical protein